MADPLVSLTARLLQEWAGQLQILVHVLIAMLLGGLIGFERELANKPAGFRTHMLVAGAAAALVGLATGLVKTFDAHMAPDAPRSDPIRVIEAIITAVSFLGAGAIFRDSRRNQVEGLTTAACLLVSSAIGIAVAARQFVVAVGVTVAVLLVLRLLAWCERRLTRRPP